MHFYKITSDRQVEYIYSQRGYPLLVYKNYVYCKNRNRSWRCIQFFKERCKAHVLFLTPECVQVFGKHDHEEEIERITQGRKAFRAIQKQQLQQQQQQQQQIMTQAILQSPQFPINLYPTQFQHLSDTIDQTTIQIKEENLDFNNS